jgi:uncharacterized repeat protein (TIGR01451 family)
MTLWRHRAAAGFACLLLLSAALAPAQTATGSYVGNGGGGLTVSGVGFQPAFVLVRSHEPLYPTVARTATMPVNTAKNLGDPVALRANLIRSFAEDGFDVGNAPDVNAAGVRYEWLAVQAEPGKMAAGSYTGDGHDSRDIIGLGFTPGYVAILPAAEHRAWQRMAYLTGESSLPFTASGTENDRIEYLLADGFQIGSDNDVNAAGETYHWIAWNAASSNLAQGGYWGNGAAAQTIDGLPFQPAWVMVKGWSGWAPLQRGASLTDDPLSLPVPAGEPIAGGIVALQPDGFTVGGRDEVNQALDYYYYVALAPDVGVDIAVHKTVSVAQAVVGVGLTYLVEVENLGTAPATGVVVSDVLPPGLELTGLATSQGSYDPLSGQWSVGSLTIGGSALLNLAVTPLVAAAGDTLHNVARLLALDQSDGKAANDSATADVTVAGADLRLTKTVDRPSPAETDTVTFTVRVRNDGPSAADDGEIADLLPAGLSFVAATASQGSYAPATGAWLCGALPVDTEAWLTVRAAVDPGTAGTVIVNSAVRVSSSPADPDSTNDRGMATVAVNGTDLEVGKWVEPAQADPGEIVRFIVRVANTGILPVDGLALADTLPAGLALSVWGATGGTLWDQDTGRWDVGALAAGAAETLQVAATVLAGTAGTTLTNRAAITARDLPDPRADNDQDAASLIVTGADLALGLDVSPPTAVYGDSVTFTVTARNDGPSDAGELAIAFALPAGLTAGTATPTVGAFDNAAGIWTVGALPAGATALLQRGAWVAVGHDTLTATAATVALDQTDTDPSDNSATRQLVVGAAADLALAAAFDRPQAAEGDTVMLAFRLANTGPDSAHAVTIAVPPPVGLSLLGFTAGTGAYLPSDAVWSLATLAPAAAETLRLRLTVDAGTVGNVLLQRADIVAAVEADPDPGNDAATATLAVASADLAIALTATPATALPGEAVTLKTVLTNAGPDTARSITVALGIPGALVPGAATATAGTWSAATRSWSLAWLAPGAADTLLCTTTVAPDAADATVWPTAATANTLSDPRPADNTDSVRVRVPGADLRLSQRAVESAPLAGGLCSFVLRLHNAGPDAAHAVTVADTLAAGLTPDDALASAGAWQPLTGLWSLPVLAPGATDSLVLTTRVAAGTAGLTLASAARVTAVAEPDPSPGQESAMAIVTVDAGAVQATVAARAGRVAHADEAIPDLLTVTLRNAAALPETLTALAVANLGEGPGTAAELDGAWRELRLAAETGGSLTPILAHATGLPVSASFSAGRARFADLALALAPGDTLRLVVAGTVALAARDGDRLAAGLAASADLQFTPAIATSGAWPLIAAPLNVDGCVAAQIAVHPPAAATLPLGATRAPVLDVTLPANGYAPDRLRRLDVVNLGSALPADLSRVEAWADDGDGRFSAATDIRLGAFAFTGERWELTALALDVPPAGARLFVTTDVAPDATEGRTVRFAIPGPPDSGIGMESANDGPLDRDVAATNALVLTRTDRILLVAAPLADTTVPPGAADAPLLRFAVVNPDTVTHRLTRLDLTNAGAGPNGGTPAQFDASLPRLQLRRDGDRDGALDDPAIDPPAGETWFSDGTASFADLAVDVPAGGSVTLFVAADISLKAADGDALGVVVAGPDAVGVTPAVEVAAAWPLDAGGRAVVDGLVAAQLATGPAPALTLGPDDGPFVAFDLTVPANGYAPDELSGLTLENRGTATPADLAGVRLLRDGGDGRFGGDDIELAPLFFLDGAWRSPLLTEPIPAGGLRLFAVVTASSAPTDSATVRLAVPRDGVTVNSGNDGPRDAAVAAPSQLLLSTAPLLATLEVGAPASTLGQLVAARLIVRNVSAEIVTGIAVVGLAIDGTGQLALEGSLPVPCDLAPGGVDTLAWTCRATAVGTLALSALAQGTSAGDGLPRRSLTAAANPHRVFQPANDLELFPVPNRPFKVSRGQTGVVPLSLTLINPGTVDGATVRLDRLRLRIEDETGAGIVPAALLSRVVVNEGTLTYVDLTRFADSGAALDLALASPVLITVNEPVTLGIRLDIAATTTVPRFRLALTDAGGLTAVDDIAGASVAIMLAEGSYPVLSGLGEVTADASGLDLAALPLPESPAGPGQADVALLALRLANPGLPDLTSDVLVDTLAFILCDTLGAAVPDPGAWLSALALRRDGIALAVRPVSPGADTVLTLVIVPDLAVPAETPVDLIVTADLAAAAPIGALRLRLASPASVRVRDEGTGTAVPVTFATDPLAGPIVRIEAAATQLQAAGTPRLPAALTVGARGVTALALALRHPGALGTAAILCDSVRLVCRDQTRARLDPARYLDRVVVRHDGAVLATQESPRGDAVSVPLGGLRLLAGELVGLDIVVDFAARAPAGSFELLIEAEGLDARDANLGAAVALAAAPGAELPLSSGLTVLQPPADLLVADFAPALPPVLPTDGAECAVGRLTLTNPATAGSGSIVVTAVALRAAAPDLAALPAGAALRAVTALAGGEVWAVADTVAADATLARLVPPRPIEIAPGATLGLELRARFRAPPPAGGLRLGLDRDDVAVLQPDGALLAVRVEAPAGRQFPFWTAAGAFTAAGLADSYANFPNPFAAGREATTFVYSLPSAARVTLRIFTPRGEPVATPVADADRAAGLHQDDRWDGRNGRGVAVQSGVYVAELRVTFGDGREERLLRKVAVVR